MYLHRFQYIATTSCHYGARITPHHWFFLLHSFAKAATTGHKRWHKPTLTPLHLPTMNSDMIYVHDTPDTMVPEPLMTHKQVPYPSMQRQ